MRIQIHLMHKLQESLEQMALHKDFTQDSSHRKELCTLNKPTLAPSTPEAGVVGQDTDDC